MAATSLSSLQNSWAKHSNEQGIVRLSTIAVQQSYLAGVGLTQCQQSCIPLNQATKRERCQPIPRTFLRCPAGCAAGTVGYGLGMSIL